LLIASSHFYSGAGRIAVRIGESIRGAQLGKSAVERFKSTPEEGRVIGRTDCDLAIPATVRILYTLPLPSVLASTIETATH
jgi:hypothetical protein